MLHRHARPAVAGAFAGGAVLGAFLSGGALVVLAGLLSPIPATARATAALLLIALLALHQARILCLPLPQRAWQIPQTVFHDDPRRAAARFAFELGTGVRTYVTSAAPYALALVLALSPGPDAVAALSGALGAAVGFGLGRSLVVLSQPAGATVAVDHPARWLTLASWLSIAASTTVALQVLAAG